jgi:hypothetical protein
MKGPFPIFFRAHSGSRLLCEAFRQNGFWMGLSDNKTRDAKEFSARVPEMKFLIQEAFRYPELPPTEKERLQQTMRVLVETSKSYCPNPESMIAYGWKQGITIFTIEIFLEAYPEAKAIHLIRDGRDVMLSRRARTKRLDEPFNRLVVFGDANVSQYRGEPLTSRVIKKYRNELEMHHWVTAVRFGMRGRSFKDRYMEVFYEDLCTRPIETLAEVFEFLEVPFNSKAKECVVNSASAGRIGKWKNYDDQLNDAIMVGEPLLRELGYL